MSWQTPDNLSADGIAVLLGYADAAEMVAAIGGEITPIAKTASFTVATGENYIRCSHASTPIVATLPAATGSGRTIRVLNLGAALTSVIRAGSDLIGGAATLWLPQYASCVLVDAASAVWDIAEYTHDPISFVATLTSSATGLSGSYAVNQVPYNSVTGIGWTNSGGLLTCALPGRWKAIAQSYYGSSVGDPILQIQLNSATSVAGQYQSGSGVTSTRNASASQVFAAGDTCRGVSLAAATHTVTGGGAQPTFLQLIYQGRL